MESTDRLVEALRAAGLNEMANKAATGYYHDFVSPLDTPSVQLAHDLRTFAEAPSLSELRRLAVRTVLARHMNGEFDATKEESDAFAASQEGRETFAHLLNPEVRHRAGRRQEAPDPKAQIGRLAFREEGEFWHAYVASPETMDGALLLATIQMAVVTDPQHKATFMGLMRDIVSDIIESSVGERPVWPAPEGIPAPESERPR